MKTFDPAAPLECHDAISECAAEFLTRRRDEAWSDADQAELDAWLVESVLHEVAYLRVEEIAARGDQLAGLNALELKRSAPDGGRNFRLRGFVFPLLIAASIALVAVFAVPYAISLLRPPDRSFSTDVGGRTLLKFTDGTEVELNTNTVMRFRMTSAERSVWLESGEAWFHVAHNAAHPFTVVIGNHRVTDLGTEFFVRRGSGDVEVALVNGRAMLNTEGAPAAILIPGDDAVATPVSMSITRKTPQQLADALAWRRGMLVFRKARLGDVAREFNRYNVTKLVITDPSVADKTITANARTDDYETILRLAEVELNLRVDREGNEILISQGQQTETKKAAHIKRSL